MKRLLKPLLKILNWPVILALLLSYLSPFISPKTFWPISFFGLSHLVWFTLGLVFLLLSILYKTKLFRYNLAVLLIGIPFLLRVISFGSPTPAPENSFRAVGFNTFALGAAAKTNTSNQIDKYLDTAGVDFAALIEWRFYSGNVSKKKFPHQVSLKRKINQGNGIQLVSRYPILRSGLVPFSSPSYNMAGYMDVDINGKVVRVYGVHLETTRLKPHHYRGLKKLDFDSTYTENAKNIAQRLKASMQKRAEQVEDIQAHMADCVHPIIVVGDFNDGPQSYTYQQLRQEKKDAFVEAGRGFECTFLRPFPLLRIDFLLYSDGLECHSYGSTKEIYSDHKLIFADFTFTDN